MKNLKINNCLFYGIANDHNQSSIDNLENILKNGFIVDHISLDNNTTTAKTNNGISLCLHPTNNNLYNKTKNNNERNFILSKQNIFLSSINCENPSIILSDKFLDDLPKNKYITATLIDDEIQILENIPLNYMVAIGLGDSINSHFQNLKLLLQKYEENSQFYHDFTEYYYNLYIRNLLIKRQNDIKLINLLLEKYNFAIPIINPLTGNEYGTYKEENYKLKKELNLIK